MGSIVSGARPMLAVAIGFWFHPCVHLGCRGLRLAQELACDESAVRVLRVQPSRYAEALFSLCEQLSKRRKEASNALALGISDSANNLKLRLIAMKNMKPHASKKFIGIGTALILVSPFLIVPWELTVRADKDIPADTLETDSIQGAAGGVQKKAREGFEQGLALEVEPSIERDGGRLERMNAMERLRAELALARARLAELQIRYRDKWPAVQEAKTRIEALEEEMVRLLAQREKSESIVEQLERLRSLERERNKSESAQVIGLRLSAHRNGVVRKLSAKPGDRVKQGDLLAQLDDREAEAQLQTVRSRYKLAKAELEIQSESLEQTVSRYMRQKRMQEKGLIGEDELSNPEMAEAQLQRAEANLEIAANQVREAELNLAAYRIYAPSDGVVRALNVREGEYIKQADVALILGVQE